MHRRRALALGVLSMAACGPTLSNGTDPSDAQPNADLLWPDASVGDEGEGGLDPHVGVDAEGNAIVVWYAGAKIYASRYAVGPDAWSGAVQVSAEGAGQARDVRVAVGASGDAVAVWAQLEGGDFRPFAARYVAEAGTWTEGVRLGPGLSGNVGGLEVATDDTGHATAVWYHGDLEPDTLWASRFDGTTLEWDDATVLGDEPQQRYLNPHVGMAANGDAVVVASSETGMLAHHYDAQAGAWGGRIGFETETTANTRLPRIGVSPAGHAVTVWNREAEDGSTVRGRAYDASAGMWGSVSVLSAVNAGIHTDPQVAIDGDGNAVVIWDGHSSMSAVRYDVEAQSWSEPIPIEPEYAGVVWETQVAVDPGGDAVAVWGKSNDGYALMFNRYDAQSQTWGTAAPLDLNETEMRRPQVALDGDGVATVVWFQSTGVWAHRLSYE